MKKLIENVGMALFLFLCSSGMAVWFACAFGGRDHPIESMLGMACYLALLYASGCMAFGQDDFHKMLAQDGRESQATQAERKEK